MENRSPWFDSLRAAQSEGEVLTVMQRYLRTFSPTVMDLLPQECRVSELRSTDEVVELTVAIVKSGWTVQSDSAAAPLVKDLSRTFVIAHDRIREFRGRAAQLKGS